MAYRFLVPSTVSDILFELSSTFPNDCKGQLSLDNTIFNGDILTELQTNATALGIDLKEVDQIVEYAKDNKGRFNIYYPAIKNVDGKACLVWGKLVKELTTLALKPTFTGEKTIFAEYDLPVVNENENENDEGAAEEEEVITLAVPLRTLKDMTPVLTAGAARTQYNKGSLHQSLAEGFGAFSPTVTTLDAGKYNIIAAKATRGYKGSLSYDITLEGYGTFKAPNKVVQKLNTLSTDAITKDSPWTLTLGELKTTEGSNGRNITYREVVHIGTSNLSKIDLSAFKFDFQQSPSTEERVPSSLLDLNVV